jgi:hypothetical protein
MRSISEHLSTGEIQAYHDHELSAEQRRSMELHLESCEACQAQAGDLLVLSERIAQELSLVEPPADQSRFTPLPAARLVLAERIGKEKLAMKSKTYLRIPRAAWASIAIVAVLALSLTFAPVRALANSFLALFRVEQIRVVQIDPANLPDQLESSSQLEYILSNNVKIEKQGEMKETADAAEASDLAGFPLRLPTSLEGTQSFLVQPETSLTFTVNLELVRGVLNDLQRSDIQLPDNLDGAVVSMEIPSSVVAQYGDCSYDHEPAQIDPDNTEPVEPRLDNCTTLAQVPSPQISAPPDIDLSKIGEAYLQVLGMSQQEAASFASSVDWTTTFVIPLPRGGAEYEQVDLNGIPATLVMEKGWTSHYMLLWVKDGVIYGLSGPGSKAKALQIAQTIQ